jgi:hypothetical protein
MSAVEDLEVDGEIQSPSVEIVVKLRSILGELDRSGESMAAIHVNNAIEALQADQGN